MNHTTRVFLRPAPCLLSLPVPQHTERFASLMLNPIPLCDTPHLFNYPPADRHLGCFRFSCAPSLFKISISLRHKIHKVHKPHAYSSVNFHKANTLRYHLNESSLQRTYPGFQSFSCVFLSFFIPTKESCFSDLCNL